jgi:DmsE family decaheme c-type cytochrome
MNLQIPYRIATLFVLCILLPTVSEAQSSDESASDAPYSRKGADTCIACHDDAEILAIFKTKHTVATDPRSPFGHGQLQCEACHGAGGAHAARVRRGQERPSPVIEFGSHEETSISSQNGMCLNCHKTDVGFGWHAGPHGNDEVACADCHASHQSRDAVLQTSTQAEVCYDCHQLQRSESLKAYSHPLFEGKMACTGCHSPHGETTAQQFGRQTINDTCYQCHAEKRGPFLWEHAPVSEDCALCHAPHGSNQPGMLTSRAPLLCQSCHSQIGHPSFAYDANGLPTGSPSQYLLGQSCLNCHTQVHGSNHPSGSKLTR